MFRDDHYLPVRRSECPVQNLKEDKKELLSFAAKLVSLHLSY